MAYGKIEMTGKKFNRLTVVSHSHKDDKHNHFWNTVCECGKTRIVNGSSLRRGEVKSCGCYFKDFVNRRRKPKQLKIKFGTSVARVKFTCHNCGKEGTKLPCLVKGKSYCSKKCHHEGMVKEKAILVCEVCNKSYEEHKSYLRHRSRKYCSIHCKRIGQSLTSRGENAPGWKGGVSYANGRIRKGVEWKMWREYIFKRDNWTCQDCGIRSGKGVKVELHPHHIKQYATHPELRFDVTNGITLCKECHKKTDTYLKPIPRPPYHFTKAVLREHRKIKVDFLKTTTHPNAIFHITREIDLIDNNPLEYGKRVQYEVDCYIDGYCRQFGITREQYLNELELDEQG